MDWFRWWHGSSDDPKLRMIASECNMPVASVIGLWATILEAASKSQNRGNIDNFDYEVVSFHLGIDVETPCNAMKRRKMLHETDGTLTVLNWSKWQPKRERDDNSTSRVREFRNKQKQALTERNDNETPCNASETQVTPREDKRREDKTITQSPSGFADFWSAYPKKVGKGAAEKAWDKAKADLSLVLAAIKTQASSDQWRKDGGQFIPNPATWITQRRWEDGATVTAEPKPFDNKAWLKELLS